MANAVRFENRGGVEYIGFSILDGYLEDVLAVFSTRKGGVSTGVYRSMNMGFETGDRKENVLKNYKIFAGAVGVDYRKLVFSSQHHNSNIRLVTAGDAGKGILRGRDYNDIDGLITDVPGIPLVTFHADCAPVYFYDSENRAIGLAHAGWRGTAAQIVAAMLDMMASAFGTDARKVKVAIGPAICGKCYGVGEDVMRRLSCMGIDIGDCVGYDEKTRKYHPDISLINKKLLIVRGVPAENISISGVCTMENPDRFFSHRVHGKNRGTQAAIMKLLYDG
jgi:YfiH family protein